MPGFLSLCCGDDGQQPVQPHPPPPPLSQSRPPAASVPSQPAAPAVPAPGPPDSSNRQQPAQATGQNRRNEIQEAGVKICCRFRYQDLVSATDNFSSRNVLGEGGFGKVYKGTLQDGTEVAVKRLDPLSLQGDSEFYAEVSLMSRLRHPNLLNLMGICEENGQKLGVFEFMSQGSVSRIVEERPASLTWPHRIRILLGAARGLGFLHEIAQPPAIHGDFKCPNVLIDCYGQAHVADFGLARLTGLGGNASLQQRALASGQPGALAEYLSNVGAVGGGGETTTIATTLRGTYGYMSPEYMSGGVASMKSDVYAFGVVILELLTGLPVIDATRGRGRENLVTWLRAKLRQPEAMVEHLDAALRRSREELPLVQLAGLCEVAHACLLDRPQDRPSMLHVVKMLTGVNAFSDTSAAQQQPGAVPLAPASPSSLLPPGHPMAALRAAAAPAPSSAASAYNRGSSSPSTPQGSSAPVGPSRLGAAGPDMPGGVRNSSLQRGLGSDPSRNLPGAGTSTPAGPGPGSGPGASSNLSSQQQAASSATANSSPPLTLPALVPRAPKPSSPPSQRLQGSLTRDATASEVDLPGTPSNAHQGASGVGPLLQPGRGQLAVAAQPNMFSKPYSAGDGEDDEFGYGFAEPTVTMAGPGPGGATSVVQILRLSSGGSGRGSRPSSSVVRGHMITPRSDSGHLVAPPAAPAPPPMVRRTASSGSDSSFAIVYNNTDGDGATASDPKPRVLGRPAPPPGQPAPLHNATLHAVGVGAGEFEDEDEGFSDAFQAGLQEGNAVKLSTSDCHVLFHAAGGAGGAAPVLGSGSLAAGAAAPQSGPSSSAWKQQQQQQQLIMEDDVADIDDTPLQMQPYTSLTRASAGTGAVPGAGVAGAAAPSGRRMERLESSQSFAGRLPPLGPLPSLSPPVPVGTREARGISVGGGGVGGPGSQGGTGSGGLSSRSVAPPAVGSSLYPAQLLGGPSQAYAALPIMA